MRKSKAAWCGMAGLRIMRPQVQRCGAASVGLCLLGAVTSLNAQTSSPDWLDGQQIGAWLQQETDRAWQAEQRQLRTPQVSAVAEAPPRLSAMYGVGRARVAELEIAGGRYRFETDANGRLPPQQAAGYRLESWRGRCLVLRRADMRVEVCWQGVDDALP